VKKTLRLLLACSPVLLVVLLYAYGLRLPLFSDDAPNFHFMRFTNGLDQWLGSLAFPYYRPIVFSFWKGLVALLGSHHAPLLHLVNVLAYGLAALLAGLLVRRLLRSDLAGWWAGVLLALYPFNYQTVLPVGSLFHVALLLGVAAAGLGALRWWDQGKRGGLLLAWGGAFLAIFSQENGFLVVGLLVGLALWRALELRRWRWRPALALLSLPSLSAVIYLSLYSILPRMNADRGLELSFDPVQGYAILLQGFVHPLAGFLRPFVANRPDSWAMLALFGVGALAGLLAMLGLRRPWWALAWLAGAAWFVLAVSPSALLLQADYVFGSPRLGTLAALGFALSWGALLAALLRTRAVRVLGLALGIWTLLLSTGFLVARRYDYERMADYYLAFVHLSEEEKLAGLPFAVVNAPYYIEPSRDQRSFLTGAEYASFVWVGLDYDLFLWVNTDNLAYVVEDAPRPNAFAHADTLRYQAGYFVPIPRFLHGAEVQAEARDAPSIIATYFYGGDRFRPVLVKPLDQPSAQGAPLASFGASGALRLSLAQAHLHADHLLVRLAWQQDAPQPVKRFVHVLCDGALLAQNDGYLWADLYPFSAWAEGEAWVEQVPIALPPGAGADCLALRVGVYGEQDGQRWTARDSQGQPLPDDSWPVGLNGP
jgi:MFS family permease